MKMQGSREHGLLIGTAEYRQNYRQCQKRVKENRRYRKLHPSCPVGRIPSAQYETFPSSWCVTVSHGTVSGQVIPLKSLSLLASQVSQSRKQTTAGMPGRHCRYYCSIQELGGYPI